METGILCRSCQLDDNGLGNDANRVDNWTGRLKKEESNFLKLNQGLENGHLLKVEGAQITTVFPVKTEETERDEIYSNRIEIKELTDGLSRMTLKNKKTKQKIAKLHQKLEASQRKIAILRSYNMDLENRKKVYDNFLCNKPYLNCIVFNLNLSSNVFFLLFFFIILKKLII